MKKLVVVLVIVSLLSSLYAGGVTENVSKNGLGGFVESINEVGELKNSGLLPEDEIEDGVSSILSGKTKEEIIDDYNYRMEQIRLNTPFFEGEYSCYGLKSEISLSLVKASFSYPEGVDDFEFSFFVDYLLGKYTLSDDCTYSFGGNALIFEYAEKETSVLYDFVSEILESADEYIYENYVNKSIVVEDISVDHIDYVEEPLITLSFDHMGIVSEVEVYSDHATISIPYGTTENDINEIINIIVKKYPEATSEIRYEIADNLFVLYYTECDEEYLNGVLDDIYDDAVAYIDSLFEKDEEVVEEVPEKVDEKALETPYETVFNYENVSLTIEAYPEYALMSPSSSLSSFDLDSLMSYLEGEGFDFFTSYYIVGDDAVFGYLKSDKEAVEREIAIFKGKLVSFIDSEKKTPEPEIVKEKTKPVTFVFDAGVRGLYKYYKGSTPVYPKLSALVNLSYSFFFIEAGGEGMCYKNYDKLYMVGSVVADAGLQLKNEMFGIFGYASARYTFATENSGFSSGFVLAFGGGLQFNFTKNLFIKASYEYLDKNHYYLASFGVRF